MDTHITQKEEPNEVDRTRGISTRERRSRIITSYPEVVIRGLGALTTRLRLHEYTSLSYVIENARIMFSSPLPAGYAYCGRDVMLAWKTHIIYKDSILIARDGITPPSTLRLSEVVVDFLEKNYSPDEKDIPTFSAILHESAYPECHCCQRCATRWNGLTYWYKTPNYTSWICNGCIKHYTRPCDELTYEYACPEPNLMATWIARDKSV